MQSGIAQRFSYKAVDQKIVAAIERIARSYEPSLRDGFLAAIRSARENATLEAIEAAIQSMNPGAAIRAATVGLEYDRMKDTLADIVEAAGQKTTAALPQEGPVRGVTLASFDVVNPYAVGYARTEVARLVRQIDMSTREGIMNLIGNAIETGVPPRQAAKQIKNWLGLTDYQANFVLNYQNKLTVEGATNIEAKVQRYADRVLGQRALTVARTECLLGSTRVSAAVITAIFRRWYEGDVVEIKTRDGCQFSATMNHPMLTTEGWITAGKLNKGNYLVSNAGQKDFIPVRNLNIETHPPTLSEIFDSLTNDCVFEWRRSHLSDFHGDGMNGYVNILRPNRALKIGDYSALYEPLANDIFTKAGTARSSFCQLCGRLFPVDKKISVCGLSQDSRVRNAFMDHYARNIVVGSQSGQRFSGLVTTDDVSSGEVYGLPSGSSGQVGFLDTFSDPGLACTDDRGDFARREAGLIEIDRVSDIRIRSWRGHVFNLSTPDGYYNISSGIYTGNTLAASNGGQRAAWQSAMDQGFLDRETEQIWITAQDERLCESCAPMPDMDENQHVPIDGMFLTGEGDYVRNPPAHPNCRCSIALNL